MSSLRMHEWRSHTAEIELAIEADSQETVFVEAAAAFGELVGGTGGERAEHGVTIEAADLDSLLVQWLEELIFLADTDSFVPETARDVRIRGTAVSATLVGRRAPLEPLVKAATYHGLRFAQEDGVWCARVVLDV
jgi:SHS2 domain-containing protein